MAGKLYIFTYNRSWLGKAAEIKREGILGRTYKQPYREEHNNVITGGTVYIATFDNIPSGSYIVKAHSGAKTLLNETVEEGRSTAVSLDSRPALALVSKRSVLWQHLKETGTAVKLAFLLDLVVYSPYCDYLHF